MGAIAELQKKIGVNADGDFGSLSAKAFMKHFQLSAEQAAHFLGQCHHETGGFSVFSENLNYSATGLERIFRSDLDSNKDRVLSTAEKLKAIQLARKPEAIANFVYANQNGNGNEANGDGWKFRGRGALQTTGKANYKALSDHLGKPEIMINPDLVATEYAFESAMFYFEKNRLWVKCLVMSDEVINKVSKVINGGTNGLEDRRKLTKMYYKMLTN
jgi:putative chitinase